MNVIMPSVTVTDTREVGSENTHVTYFESTQYGNSKQLRRET
jgi:hypothetical protein